MLSASDIEFNKQKRADLLKEAGKIWADEQPGVALVARTWVFCVNLDFSDQLQPNIWDYVGMWGQKLESVYWVKGTAPATTAATTTTARTTTTAAPPSGPIGLDQTLGMVVTAIVVIGAALWMARRRKRKT